MHRDIKPGNLLIDHRGRVKISDFGIVRDLAGATPQAGGDGFDGDGRCDTFIGTVTYMSPERIAGEPYSYNSDVWALGVTLMACALGEFPFDRTGGYWGMLSAMRDKPPPQLPEGRFSAAFREFLALCMTKDPKRRPSAAAMLAHDFAVGSAAAASSSAAAASAGDAGSDGGGYDDDDFESVGESSGGGAGGDAEEWSDSDDELETARSELDEIAEAVSRFYVELWARQAAHALAPTPPVFDPPRLSALAAQLAIPRRVVVARFRRLIGALRFELDKREEPG